MVCTHSTVFVLKNLSKSCWCAKNFSWLQSFTRTTRHHFSGQWNPHYLWRSGSGVQSRAKQQHFETGWLGCPPFYAMLVIIDEQKLGKAVFVFNWNLKTNLLYILRIQTTSFLQKIVNTVAVLALCWISCVLLQKRLESSTLIHFATNFALLLF